MLTAQILTPPNHPLLNECLSSLNIVATEILLENISFNASETRNTLTNKSSNNYCLWLHPWEKLICEELLVLTDVAYRVYVVYEEVLVKETRIWHKDKLHFINPVYETLVPDVGTYPLLDCFIVNNGQEDHTNKLERWHRRQPYNCEINYYKALNFLQNKKYKEFLTCAQTFLFQSNILGVSQIMINYYLCHVYKFYKQFDKALQHIITCLTHEPLLAEFWCLLGDLFFCQKQFLRALAFYDNAIILGSKRRRNDNYPIELKKYKKYPEQRILAIRGES